MIEIILILIIIALNDDEKTATAYVVKEIPKEIEFKTFTKAICEERNDHLFCRDELFVKCNDKEYAISNDSLNNLIECNNIKLNLSDTKVNASGVFKKRWVDTRKQT